MEYEKAILRAKAEMEIARIALYNDSDTENIPEVDNILSKINDLIEDI